MSGKVKQYRFVAVDLKSKKILFSRRTAKQVWKWAVRFKYRFDAVKVFHQKLVDGKIVSNKEIFLRAPKR